jgi:putative Mn2+ efflux pump MntP
MSSWALLLVLPAFSLDTLGVSAAMAAHGRRQAAKVVAVFMLFEAGMPIVGALMGGLAARSWSVPAMVAGGLLLVIFGGREAWHEWQELKEETGDPGEPRAPRPLPQGWALLTAAFSVSVDELALGAGLGAGGMSLAVLVPLLALQSLVFSWLGFAGGRELKARLGPRFEVAAGLILVLAGVWFIAGALVGA